MGQKINPNSIRLALNQKHYSNWYANSKTYPSLVKEDAKLREQITLFLNKTFNISNIEINRLNNFSSNNQLINIKLNCLIPKERDIFLTNPGFANKKLLSKYLKYYNLVYKKNILETNLDNENFKKFSMYLIQKIIRNLFKSLNKNKNKHYSFQFNFFDNPFLNSTLLAKYITQQIVSRVPFRRILNFVILNTKQLNMKGVKIQLSGRLNGAEIARSEWLREGKTPLHTLNAKIDYTSLHVKTIYGIIGIKIWLFK